ncbi:hydrolase [soil metagenome]
MLRALAIALILASFAAGAAAADVAYYNVPKGSHPHDVAPASDGTVWFTAQGAGSLGRLDPKSGAVHLIPLGQGSAPHGVIVGPDGAAWVTDGGLSAIVRVDARTEKVTSFPLPKKNAYANLNTATFDKAGRLWFTGQAGVYGRFDLSTGVVTVWDAPRGAGPYGITTTPSGGVYYASLAGSHIARIDTETGAATAIEPPTRGQGARRVWSDSKGLVWVSEWNAGQVSAFDPVASAWQSWKLPGSGASAYAVYVDETDAVWLTDFTANAVLRFDRQSQRFTSYPSDKPFANVRQLNGRPGEVWGAESGTDRLVVIRSAATQ